MSFVPSFLRSKPSRRIGARRAARPEPVEVLEQRQLLAANALNMINLPAFESAYPSLRGQGQAIAIIDSGFDLNHPSFGPDLDHNGIADRIVYQHDFGDDDANASEPAGPASHGSFVTSLAAGSTVSGMRGIAQQADIIALKVGTDANPNSFSTTTIVAALDWVIDNAVAFNIVAVNCSFGSSLTYLQQATFSSKTSPRFRSLEQLGVIVVAAAGNDYFGNSEATHGQQGLANIAADENTIAVGAVVDTSFSTGSGAYLWNQLANQQAYFSQRADRLLDVVAPGVNMLGASNTGTIWNWNGNQNSGTSFATPIVAGAVVLAQQRAQQVLGRRLTTSEFRSLIQTTGGSLLTDFEVSEGGSKIEIPNSLDSFRLLNVKALIDGITPNPESLPRAIPTAALAQPITQNGGSDTQGRAHLTWDPAPDCVQYDVFIANVPATGGWKTVYSRQVYYGTGVNGVTLDAAWTRTSTETNRYVWWVRAWNAASNTPGEYSYARTLYLTSDVPVPVSPSYVGLPSQGFQFGVKFSESAYAAVYDIQVEHQVGSGWESEYSVTDLLHPRFAPGAELLAGTYRTRARARNADSESSTWGVWSQFLVSDIQYVAPTYLGASTVSPNHLFRWSDTNPIGKYAAQILSGGTALVTDFTTESELEFNTNLTTGARTLVLYAYSDGEMTPHDSKQFSINVVNDVPIPGAPSYNGNTTFDGSIVFQWTKTAVDDNFDVIVWNSQNQTVLDVRHHYGNTLTADLRSGTYKFWVRSYNSEGEVSGWSTSAGTSITVAHSFLAAPTGISASTSGNLVAITWTGNSKAKYYEIWIGRQNVDGTSLEYEVIRSRAEDSTTFYASLGTGSYRTWLRAWNHDDDYDQTAQTPWSAGFTFIVS